MPAHRRIPAIFTDFTLEDRAAQRGVVLTFRPTHTRLGVNRIDDFAEVGPELTVAAVAGLGKVLRILRAARIAHPPTLSALVGREERAAALLKRARGTPVVISLRPRTRVRFVAWTEAGVHMVSDVAEVIESADAYFVTRRGGRFPVRLPRETVVRQRTEAERWYEVLGIERP